MSGEIARGICLGKRSARIAGPPCRITSLHKVK